MRRLSNLPIRWRLTILYGGIISLILLVFSGGVYIYFENSLQKSIDTKIRSMGEVISSSMTDVHDPSLFGNFERYLENVLGRKPKGKLIQIMDSSGKIGAKSSDIEAENFSASFSTLERALAGEVVYETVEKGGPRLRLVTIPIMDNKKVTSIVQVGTSLEDFDETMRRLLIILISRHHHFRQPHHRRRLSHGEESAQAGGQDQEGGSQDIVPQPGRVYRHRREEGRAGQAGRNIQRDDIQASRMLFSGSTSSASTSPTS